MASRSVMVLSLLPKASALCGNAQVVSPDGNWVWNHDVEASESCTSPAMENNAMMCEGDPTSIVWQGHGGPQCLSSVMHECNFNLREITQLDFDVTMSNCDGIWAAPLWLVPSTDENYGPVTELSGEIDMIELCPAGEIHSNWANWGDGYLDGHWSGNADYFSGHVTMWIDPYSAGTVKVKVCNPDEAAQNGGSCSQYGAASRDQIFNSHACIEGRDCTFHLVSDLYNGLSGDAGFQSCAKNSPISKPCSFSVGQIRLKSTPGTFQGKCAALVQPSWGEHPWTNCYQGHGASTDLDVHPGLPNVFGEVQCKAACDAYPGCTAITVGSDGACYRHAGLITDTYCVMDSWYTTHIKNSASVPTPIPSWGWEPHSSTNCYEAHGSPHDLDHHPGMFNVVGADACKVACDRQWDCTAITVGSEGECYRHTGYMRMWECETDSWYTTYTKPSFKSEAEAFVV